MAREPYRSRMLAALDTLGASDQQDALREFVVHEAGSSHSDVIACGYMERIVWAFSRGRTGYPEPGALERHYPAGKYEQPWWLREPSTPTNPLTQVLGWGDFRGCSSAQQEEFAAWAKEKGLTHLGNPHIRQELFDE